MFVSLRNHFGILSDCTVKASLPEKSERRHLRCGRQLDRLRFHHPVYQYTLDGQEYRVVSRVEYSKKDEIKVGSYEVLFVDEKNPRYFSCPSENRERVISALIWSVLGVAFALFPLVGWGGWIGFLVALGLLLLGDLCYDAWSKNRKE